MDSGTIVEFDEPHNLLQHEDGVFNGMVKVLGEHEFNQLAQIALAKFNSKLNEIC